MTSSLPAQGWHHCASYPPPPACLLEFGYLPRGREWAWRMLLYAEQVKPRSGHHENLYWRWTGIGKEEFAARERKPIAKEYNELRLQRLPLTSQSSRE